MPEALKLGGRYRLGRGACWIGVHQWRLDHYIEFIASRFVLIERVSCARCVLLRSKAVV